MTELVRRALAIMSLTDEMEEVDDECLETWLMEGPPDGSTLEEIVDYISEGNTYDEWYNLGQELLRIRSTLY